jgi:hypothetical protein
MVESKSGYPMNDINAHSEKVAEFTFKRINGLALHSERIAIASVLKAAVLLAPSRTTHTARERRVRKVSVSPTAVRDNYGS